MNILVLAPDDKAHVLRTILRSLGETPCDEEEGAPHGIIAVPAELGSALGRFPGVPITVWGGAMPAEPSLAQHGGPVMGIAEELDYQELLEALYRMQRRRHDAPTQLLDDGLVGNSAAIRSLRELLQRVAGKTVTVLITGPSGTGKELVARNLHQLSPRREGPFVPVNCGAIPRELLESELFGHERGAFTGAIAGRAGRFELAAGGTLFLDEIGDMPLDMQVKILRVLQERRFERVGSNTTLEADVRVVAATHRNLEAMIASGEFREDLYYRLNVFPLEVPPLTQRRDDIPALVRHIGRQLEEEGLGKLRLTPAAISALIQAEWAGNVRELANLLERLLITHGEQWVGVRELPEKYRDQVLEEGTGAPDPQERVSAQEPLNLKGRLEDLEQSLIQEALSLHGGVVSRAAEHLGLRRTTLIEKMRKFGIASR